MMGLNVKQKVEFKYISSSKSAYHYGKKSLKA